VWLFLFFVLIFFVLIFFVLIFFVLIFFFVESGDRLQIFSFEDLQAFLTFYVVNASTSGNDFGAEMVTHNGLMASILMNRKRKSSAR